MTLRARRLLLAALAFAAIAPLGANCGPPPSITIDSPSNGLFTEAGSIQVTGQVTGVPVSQLADVTVNGSSVLPLDSEKGFSASVPLDGDAIFNPIVAEFERTDGLTKRARVTVVAGDSIPDGDVSPMGVALRLNDTGLDQVEPVVTDLVDLDLSELLPGGTQVINDYCVQEIFGACVASVDVAIANSPEPSVSDFGIDVDSMTDFVAGDVQLTDVHVPTRVTGAASCDIDITANTADILGDYALSPQSADPTQVDVTQQGSVSVQFGGFNDSTDCDGLLGGLVELLIDLLVGDIQDIVEPALVDFLNETDAQGNTPVAGAIEGALTDVEISGPIGEAIGVGLETPLFDVFEDPDGITLDADARITAAMPDPEAVDLSASYHVPDAFPSFGPTTPDTGTPYDLAIGISNSGFNQLLKAEIESGLLLESLTELSIGGGSPQPVTAGLLSTFIPEFGDLDPSTPVRIDLKPTLAPVVSGEPGPNGEIAELRASHLLVGLVVPANNGNDTTLIEVALDVNLGLELGFSAGELSFNLSQPASENVDITVLQNKPGTNEAALENLLVQLIPTVFPSLADSLGTFPLPEFLGLELQLVEIGKNGEFMSLFVNLAPAP